MNTQPLRKLGVLPVAQFMRDAWQRRPLLLRNALPGFVPPVGTRQLLEFARSPEAEARLIERADATWKVSHGPLRRLPSPRRPHWTVLVQGVDLLDAGAHALLQRFRFVPDARLDDLMVSYATEGGGVGPHVDSYDVFLLQAHGRRRWRISRQRDLQLVDGAPLRLLANFRPSAEYILEPGDLLYLPPGVAHEGTALVEILQNCNIFNDGAWEPLKDADTSDDHLIRLVDGEQVRFGKDGSKVVIRGADGHLTVADAASVDESQIIVFDSHAKDPGLAFALSRLSKVKSLRDTAIGVFRDVERPSYDRLVREQVAGVRESGAGDLDALIRGKDT